MRDSNELCAQLGGRPLSSQRGITARRRNGLVRCSGLAIAPVVLLIALAGFGLDSEELGEGPMGGPGPAIAALDMDGRSGIPAANRGDGSVVTPEVKPGPTSAPMPMDPAIAIRPAIDLLMAPTGQIFSDGFESGDLGGWSSSTR
jgi:hypothetical protein